MENRLLKGWTKIELQELVSYRKGKKPKILSSTEFKNSVPYLNIKAVDKNVVDEYADIASSNISNGDEIFVVWDGARSGWVAKGMKGAIGSTLVAIKSYLLNTDYLFRFLQTQFDKINSNPRGTGIPHVDPELFWSIKVPLPPLEEQHRIVTKLDALLTRVTNCKNRLEKIPILLKNFRQSVLAAAVSGELTKEWRDKNNTAGKPEKLLKDTLKRRKDFWLGQEKQKLIGQGKSFDEKKLIQKYKEPIAPENELELPDGWITCNWNQISNWVTYGFTRPMPDTETGIPKITVKHVRNGLIDFDSCEFTSKEAFDRLNPKDKPEKGDILITKDGATLGRSAIVQMDQQFCIGQSVAVIWLRSTDIERKFLHYVIESRYTQKIIWDVARGMGMPHLSITDFMAINFGLPSLEEQKEIVRKVEELFHFADSMEARYQKAKAWFDKLPQAILAKAFRGELVEQDENDEPASVLLERIKKEKQNTNKSKPIAKRKKVFEENEGVSLAAEE